uniref:rho guanine nucleotide exchange factor 19 isoform X2 n=1 Tax=Gasterosteus aculeatus aculeatus TaxID=481459 RepID=UPI001A9803AD|nr:rho guanine nucleotide exchange factor 19 isoform X2 [Gasterosteus aculeatus aculeatus]
MAQFNGGDEKSRCLIRGVIPYPNPDCCNFDDSLLVDSLISPTQTMRAQLQRPYGWCLEPNSAPDCGGLGESRDPPSQFEDGGPPPDISTALRSLAGMHGLNMKKPSLMHKLFSVPAFEDHDILSPEDFQDKSGDWAADRTEEDLCESFQSKFVHYSPLYQEYFWRVWKENPPCPKPSFVSQLITPHVLDVHDLTPTQYFSDATLPPYKRLEGTLCSPLSPCVKSAPYTLWQDLKEVVQSGLLSDMTTSEIRLQEARFELISSEASYLRSLRVVVNHFCASEALRKALNRMEHHFLFSNITCVMAASEKFLIDLEMRLSESVLISQVGDIVLQHCTKFQILYVPYLTNMMFQERMFNRLLEQNRDFLSSIKKLESNSVCQRRSLKSFLVLPFQRITRIKLILESILKLTDRDSDSIANLEKAIEAIHQMVMECNKGVERYMQTEELVRLEMTLDFDKVKSVPLVSSGRFLVRQGPMRRLHAEVTNASRVSFVSIHLHLFNDLLIISEKALKFKVMAHASTSSVHIKHLDSEACDLPTHSFLLTLSQSHSGQQTAMILVANTRSDKEEWIEALSSKQ